MTKTDIIELRNEMRNAREYGDGCPSNPPHDKDGNILNVGDVVHDCWGGDFCVMWEPDLKWHLMLVCERGHSCETIPYALNQDQIEKITLDEIE